jgi:hypothetical protein
MLCQHRFFVALLLGGGWPGEKGACGHLFALAERDAIVHCKIQKFSAFLPFKSHSQGKFFSRTFYLSTETISRPPQSRETIPLKFRIICSLKVQSKSNCTLPVCHSKAEHWFAVSHKKPFRKRTFLMDIHIREKWIRHQFRINCLIFSEDLLCIFTNLRIKESVLETM